MKLKKLYIFKIVSVRENTVQEIIGLQISHHVMSPPRKPSLNDRAATCNLEL